MNNQSRMLLRAMVGGYLVYLGGSLATQVLQEKPNNMILMLLAGIFFVVAGGAVLIYGLKGYMKARREDIEAEELEMEEEDDTCE